MAWFFSQPIKKGKPSLSPIQRGLAKAKKSNAAKKAARTRKRNASAKAKREQKEKRSRAARKGWETRRAAPPLTAKSPEGRQAEREFDKLTDKRGKYKVRKKNVRVVYIPKDGGPLRYFDIESFDDFMSADLYDDPRGKMKEDGRFVLGITNASDGQLPLKPSRPKGTPGIVREIT